MKWTVMLLASVSVLTGVSTEAKAEIDAIMCDTSRGGVFCQWGSTLPPSARVIHRTPALGPEAEARMRRWEEFCKPTPEVDRYGVTRLRYAHEGCEYGRDH